MKNNFILLLMFLSILIFPNPIWSQNILVSSSNGDLMIVNPDYCSTSILCNGSYFMDLAYEGGVLYGIYSNDIYTIDTSTCFKTLFVSLPQGGNALVGDENGSLYANSMNLIYKIDIATQTISLIGDVGYASMGDLAFNKGFLYQLVYGGVYISTLIKITLNPFSVTTIGNLNFNNLYAFGLVDITPNTDTLYATVSDPPNSVNYLYKINVNDA